MVDRNRLANRRRLSPLTGIFPTIVNKRFSNCCSSPAMRESACRLLFPSPAMRESACRLLFPSPAMRESACRLLFPSPAMRERGWG
ncbi:MAG: hypothetical protein JW959_00635 [Pirellulales bacterium]|nr:hypothetical protein [Pirellulales bacterium]